MSEKLEDQVRLLLEKVDRILQLLETRPSSGSQRSAKAAAKKSRAEPLSPDEIARHQERFERLFGAWDSGEEVQVEKELAEMDADEIRRFADANNLNVTSKTPKQKVMHLIAGRFRERRQLMRSHFNRRSSGESS